MAYTFINSWTSHAEDPIGAAVRANVTAARNVTDTAHDYQSALASGNKAAINSAKAAFRQAWESDVRRRGGRPEDFIPNYPNADPIPVVGPPPYGWFGQTETTNVVKSPVIQIMTTMAILYILWMFLA